MVARWPISLEEENHVKNSILQRQRNNNTHVQGIVAAMECQSLSVNVVEPPKIRFYGHAGLGAGEKFPGLRTPFLSRKIALRLQVYYHKVL